MFPASLHPDHLYCFVIGPSMGETILVRIPPNNWLVVDSFLHARRPAAAHVLQRYAANWSFLILTHPHGDHYEGMDTLLELNPAGIVGCVHPSAEEVAREETTANPLDHLSQGALPVYDAIKQHWASKPATRWETFRGEKRQLGAATLTALNPPRPVRPREWSKDLNRLSTAVLLEWAGVRLLLGADVVRSRWAEIAVDFTELGIHSGLKVPHHGSDEAVHASYGNGRPGRCWVVTPYNRCGKKLPCPDDGDGMDLLLRFVDQLSVTALPFRHDRELESPCQTTRQEIRDKTRPTPVEKTLPGGRRGAASAPVTTVERHVILEYDTSGKLQNLYFGEGTVAVSTANQLAERSASQKSFGRGRGIRCQFCTSQGCPRPVFVDYKDTQILKRFSTSQGKLLSRKRTGTCAVFQRAVKTAIRRARFMALLPYVGE